MATVTTSHKGNLALETDIWTFTLGEAKASMAILDTHKGSYWDSVLVKPYRRAVRAKAQTLRVYTAGFATGELSNVVHAAGGTVSYY